MQSHPQAEAGTEAEGETEGEADIHASIAGYGKREFDPADFKLKFIPREEFYGRRAGYVFRLGAQGLGYYEDKDKKKGGEQQHLEGEGGGSGGSTEIRAGETSANTTSTTGAADAPSS
jgi:hypothetical protein